MSKDQALSIISELAYKAELPKGLTGNEAKMYIDQLNMAINILESCIKDN